MSPPKKTPTPPPWPEKPGRPKDARPAEQLAARTRGPASIGPARPDGEAAAKPLGAARRAARESADARERPLPLSAPEKIGLEAGLPDTSAAPALGPAAAAAGDGGAGDGAGDDVRAGRGHDAGADAGTEAAAEAAPGAGGAAGGAANIELAAKGADRPRRRRAAARLDRPARPGERDEAHDPPEAAPARRNRQRRRRLLARPLIWAFDIAVLCVVALVLAVLLTAGRELPAPDWLATRVEARLNAGLGGARAEMGGLFVIFRRDGLPRVTFRDVDIRAADGGQIAHVPALEARLDKGALLKGRVQPRSITIRGATLRAARDEDGRLDLRLGEAGLHWSGAQSLSGLLEQLDTVLALPSFAPIEEIAAENLVLEFADARSGREWVLYDGTLVVRQTARDVSARLALQLAGDVDAAALNATEAANFGVDPASVVLNFSSPKGSTAAELGARVEGVAAQDLAAQSPALAFMALLDAPISGAMRAGLDDSGALAELAGQLEIGAGFIEPGQGQEPVKLEGGRSYFRYQPEAGRLVFDELRLSAGDVAFAASGRAYLEGMEQAGWPTDLVGQLSFSEVSVNPTGVFETGAEFDGGALDLKLSLDPLRLRIGQMVLNGKDVTLRATGRARPVPEGWEAAIDLSIDRIGHERLLALWPLMLATRTRDWIAERVRAGELFNVTGALRVRPGEERPIVSLVYEYRDAEVLVLPTLPPVQGASGYSSITDDSYTMSLDAGYIDAPQGGRVDVAGSVLRVPDVHREPAEAEVELISRSSGTAVLSLLDQEPWRFMSKAGQPVDIAEGRAALEGLIRFPLIKDVPKELIDFRVTGVLSDVRSEKVVPGRVLTADRLELSAHGEEITISGPGRIEGLPISATWVQPIDKPGPQPSRVEGSIELSQAFVDRFNIGLPEGMVSGVGRGQFSIELERGRAPRFRLSSDLNRVGLTIRELAWRKGRGQTGSLQVSGALGEPPVIDRLVLEAPGFSAQGRVTLNPGGGLKSAEFSRVHVGDWIDAPVTLSGRGKGRTPQVRVDGGWIDVRRTSFAQGGGGAPAGAPMSLALDRLVISDGISLRGFRADLSTRGGLNGAFRGRVNGGAPISGALVPIKGRTAVRISSQDAGGVFRAAGLFRKGQGGAMELTLLPRPEPGQYNGELKVSNVRVQGAPGLAALLNAISVVGLIEQMSGPGILLSNTEVKFRLTPNAVQISQGSAVGPSIGISMAGLYDMNRDFMEVQGVFSPIYVINGIGQIFSRKGEGMFGFNYKMTGPASDPKVSVNPLSLLTPGIFREIFRQPPPTLDD